MNKGQGMTAAKLTTLHFYETGTLNNLKENQAEGIFILSTGSKRKPLNCDLTVI